MSVAPLPEILVFDVGGTTLRAGLYSATGCVDKIERRETPSFRTLQGADGSRVRKELYAAMASMARAVLGDRTPGCVSVAFPGPIDPAGRVRSAPTLWGASPGAEPLPVRAELQRLWPATRLFLLNDITAAGYRVMRDPAEDFCVLTVSSGIGNKIFVRGEPLVGPGGRGGELGHLRVDFSSHAPVCDCGGRGHLGAVSSGRATAYHVRRLVAEDPDGFRQSELGCGEGGQGGVNNTRLAQALRNGDPWTERLVRRMARPLGQVLAAVHLAVGIERFVLIGGFALALGDGFREMVAEAAAACDWDSRQDWGRMIELVEQDEETCLIGAGIFARAVLNDNPETTREQAGNGS